jgi:hypothetical protein
MPGFSLRNGFSRNPNETSPLMVKRKADYSTDPDGAIDRKRFVSAFGEIIASTFFKPLSIDCQNQRPPSPLRFQI